jgi:hypothetical protein
MQIRRLGATPSSFPNRPPERGLVTIVAPGTRLDGGADVAGVAPIVVREEDPPDVLRVDEPEDLLDPVVAEAGGARVHDHRLGSLDHQRADVQRERCPRHVDERADQVGALGDPDRVRDGVHRNLGQVKTWFLQLKRSPGQPFQLQKSAGGEPNGQLATVLKVAKAWLPRRGCRSMARRRCRAAAGVNVGALVGLLESA